MAELPRIISVDDHVVEPANVWMDRLPSKYKGVGPRIVRAPMGEITIVCDYCGESAAVAYTGTGRPPLFCSAQCRQWARQPQRQTDADQHGAARVRRWRAAHPEWVAGQRERRQQERAAWRALLARLSPDA